MAYDPTDQDSQIQKYRLLDAPFTRYWIGAARVLTNSPSLGKDWNWSLTWQENSVSLPNQKLLMVSRISIAILLPASFIIFFLLLRKLFSGPISLLASVLFFSNSLILLHGRRAMAEGGLLFFLILSLFLIFSLPKRWFFLSSVPVSMAFNTKQSMVVLVIFALIVLITKQRRHFKHIFLQTFLFSIVFIAFFYAVNPVIWNDPFAATRAMWKERSQLTYSQVEVISSASPGFIVTSLSQKATALIGQLFVVPPMSADVANYQAAQLASVESYFHNPINQGLGRNLTIGSLNFLLVVYGLVISLRLKSLTQYLLVSVFAIFTAELLLMFQVPFQRYYIMLIPFTCLYCAVALEDIYGKLKATFFTNKDGFI